MALGSLLAARARRGNERHGALLAPGHRACLRLPCCGDREAPRSEPRRDRAAVFRACRELGIATVAVVALDDRGSLHARSADQSVEIGSYLFRGARSRREGGRRRRDPPRLRVPGREPRLRRGGRGRRTGLRRPDPEALRLGGDKLEAKRVAQENGVPVVPTGEPAEVGYPLIIKAAAGGGGRGMRVVRQPSWTSGGGGEPRGTQRSATTRVFFERYLDRPRHVEIQLLPTRMHVAGARRARVLDPAPAPEGARGVAVDGARSLAPSGDERCRGPLRRSHRLSQRGHREFMLAGPDFYLLELNGESRSSTRSRSS